MVTCNINDRIKFRLTVHGKQFLAKHLQKEYVKYGANARELYQPDCCGYIMMQLHEFMNIFGPAMTIGFDNVIENNELIFCGC